MKKSITIILLSILTSLMILFPTVSIAQDLIDQSDDINTETTAMNNLNMNVSIEKPNGFVYVFDIPLAPLPPMMPFKAIIIGPVTVSVSVDSETVDTVEFYVDNQMKHSTSTSPYEWTWNEGLRPPPIHNLKVIAYSGEDSEMDEIRVLYINPF